VPEQLSEVASEPRFIVRGKCRHDEGSHLLYLVETSEPPELVDEPFIGCLHIQSHIDSHDNVQQESDDSRNYHFQSNVASGQYFIKLRLPRACGMRIRLFLHGLRVFFR
jgi:hypothetical protein